MDLPFTTDDFFDVFAQYNDAVWPMQIVLLVLAGVTVALIGMRWRWSGAAISASLALLWAWLAIAYHVLFLSEIDPIAWGYALVSLAGAGAFAWFGTWRRQLVFGAVGWGRAIAGSALIAFALALYPVWSYRAGHPYPWLPTFGTPGPTTLFTVGVLAFLEPPYPLTILIVPLAWSLVGAVAAVQLDVPQDLALVASAAVAAVLLVRARLAARPVGE